MTTPRRYQHWHTFKSPLTPTINTGEAKQAYDWSRDGENDLITINGRSLSSLLQEDRKLDKKPESPLFKDIDELKIFFEKHFLANVPSEHQPAALDFLIRRMHQGGLLHPISGSIAEHIIKSSKSYFAPLGSELETHTAFVTTPNGFNVQEQITQRKLRYGMEVKNKEPEDTIEPDKGYDFVYKAQVTLAVTFPNLPLGSEESYQPQIAIQSQSISYGNQEVRKVFNDGRGLLERLLDSLLYYLGYNREVDLAPVEQAKPSSLKR